MGVAIAGAIACGRSDGTSEKPAAAEVWVTTGDQAKLLAREPDVPIVGADTTSGVPRIDVDESVIHQEMVGFGASITDASAIVIQRLPPARRDSLLQELFGTTAGIGSSFTRLTIGASDFSPTHYSLDDVPRGQSDPTLARVTIEPNRATVLPVVKRALEINPELAVMASPWCRRSRSSWSCPTCG